MADVVEMKMARLGDVLADMEEKADSPFPPKKPGKGGKAKPKPPWLDNDADDDEDTDASDSDDDESDEDDDDKPFPPKKKPAKGTKAAKPGTGFKPKQPERGGTTRKPAVRARANRTGAEVQPIAWTAGSDGRKRKPGMKSARGAARITTWGPTNQHVDVRRGRGDGAGDQGPSDPRLRRASREQDTDSFRPRRGSAGGNGVTAGRGGNEIQSNVPGRLKKRPARRDGWRPSADVGEGHTGGRSGSAIVSNRPGNLRKDLWTYDASEVKSAIEVVQKALAGLATDLESRDF